METNTHVFFFGHKPNTLGTHIFSQWWPVTFSEDYDGLTVDYINAEQYMMCHKALLFSDTETYGKIITCTAPSKIKALGRQVKNFDPAVWDEHKFAIVLQGTRLKFTQNPALLERLLATGDKIIVEASPFDRIWGCGLSATQAATTAVWPGENLLGQALMVIREENIVSV